MNTKNTNRSLFNRKSQRRLRVQKLENRELLAADLEIVDLQLANASHEPITEVAVSEMAIAQANRQTSDLTSDDQYREKFEIDGIPVYFDNIAGGEGFDWSYYCWSGVGTPPDTIAVNPGEATAIARQTDSVGMNGGESFISSNGLGETAFSLLTSGAKSVENSADAPSSSTLLSAAVRADSEVSMPVFTDGSTVAQPETDFTVSGDIVVDTFWMDPSQPYTLVGDVRVRKGATLFVGPNVTVNRTSSQHDLFVGVGNEQGKLSADHSKFNIEIFNSATAQSQFDGVIINSGQVVVEDRSEVIFTNSAFHNGTPLSVHPEFPHSLAGKGNAFSDGATVEIRAGVVDGDTTWPILPGMATYELLRRDGYATSAGPRVRNGAVLTIANGVTVQEFGSDTDLRIGDNGSRGSLVADDVTFIADVVASTRSTIRIANSNVAARQWTIESGSDTIFSGTSFHTGTPLSVHPEFPDDLEGHGNSFGDGARIEITNGIIDEDTTWPLLPGMSLYQLKSYSGIFAGTLGPRVRDNAFLYLDNGVHLFENGSDTDLRISDNGTGGGFVSEGARLDVDLYYLANSDGWITDSLLGPTHQLVVDATTHAKFFDNDFSEVSTNRLVAIGDAGATIDVRGNFWGEQNANQIELRLLDNIDDENRPRFLYEPTLPANPLSPVVDDIRINSGQSTRSHVTHVTIDFDRRIRHELLSEAFTLRNVDSSEAVGQIEFDARDVAGFTSVLMMFSGESTDARAGHGSSDLLQFNSLSDGNYLLEINHEMIVGAFVGVAMEDSFIFGALEADHFFRLFGDDDGDRDVDGQDYGKFGLSFLRSSGSPGFNSVFDADGDGDVDGQDYGRFGQNFLTTLNF